MKRYRPERVLVEEAVSRSHIAENVRKRLPEVPFEFIESAESLLKHSKRWSPTIAQGKRVLVLSRHRGRFFKPCPAGTSKAGAGNACCNYFVVNYASNCHMECSYCYLQDYLNLPYMVIHANHEDLLSELEETFRGRPLESFRVGTGELADSLALDPLTGYSRPLVEFFASFSNAALEFKTKSDCIEELIGLEHRGRTVVSWSISPNAVARGEEHKTASPTQRLRAASRCAQAGYPIVFHFDPIVHYPEWEKDYRRLVEEVFDTVPPACIPWVSLGALRMTAGLKELIRERFPRSRLPLGELVPSRDGKLRYFKPIRLEMLSKMRRWIEAAAPRTRIYTCMESSAVYQRVFERPAPDERTLGDSLLLQLQP